MFHIVEMQSVCFVPYTMDITTKELKSTYEKLFNFFDLISNSLGFGILRSNWKLGPKAIGFILLNVSGIITVLHTIYIDRHDFMAIFEDSILLGIEFQVIL